MPGLAGVATPRRFGGVVALAALALGAGLGPVAWPCGATAQPQQPVAQASELRIEGGEVAGEVGTPRVTEGDRMRLRWTADAPTLVHLQGYDIESEVASGQVIAVPADALLPEPATGRLQPVGSGKTAKTVLKYGAMTSLFHDGTRTELADILYPFAFAYRWGAEGEGDRSLHDPAISRATALIRERLAGLRATGVDAGSKSFRIGDMEFVREMQLVEVYLNAAAADAVEAAAVAPPWSDVPWHVIALMEEAVARGWAAFSEQEARRRGVPWLDVVRDAPLKERLARLVDEFARDGFVPGPLAGMVSPAEARARWQALAAFYAEHEHFLATNGPYALTGWSPEATVLEVFRDASYPLGVGSFDAYAVPRRAYVADIEVRDGGIRIAATIEKVEKIPRSYRIVREAVAGGSALAGETLECRYLVVDADGTVRRASRGRLEDDGTFRIDLDQEDLAPGRYSVLVTLVLNGNLVDPDIRAVPYEIR